MARNRIAPASQRPTLGYAGIAEYVDPQAARFRRDPVAWAESKGVELWSKQREILESVRDNKNTAVRSCHEIGKALSLDTEIPTPDGWTLMGDLEVGDRVYDERGRVCHVTGVTPTWNVDAYRVTLGDGTEITASGDHEWQVWHTAARHRAGGVDRRERWDLTVRRTTAQLAGDLRGSGRHRQVKWFIPVAQAVQGDDSIDLPVPPYLLGLWLGDGSKTTGSIVCHVDDVDEIMSHVDWPHRLRQTGKVVDVSLYGLIGELRQLGLYDNKHIPAAYLRAGVEARRELLRGLMDLDGHCVRGRCDSGQKNRRLADDLYELVTGLGVQVRRSTKNVFLYGKPCGQSHVVGFTCDFEPFKLKRKLARWRPQSSGSTLRSIIDIRRIDTVPTRCISVDSPSHLYLATRSYVPTHNSFSAALTCCWFLDTHAPGETFVVTSAPTDKQVEAILWREINKMHSRLELAGRTNLKEWYVGNELVAFGRKPSDYDPTAFQGIHARYILIILDEACGMPKELWDAASTLGANVGGKMLAIGNPDDEFSHFASLVANPNWHNIRVAYWDTPNFTGEPVSPLLKEMLIHPDWVEEKRHDWGEGSALFTSKCEGEFPRGTSPFIVIPVTWIERCQQLELPPQQPIEAGIDIGGGGDRTVVRLRYGQRLGPSFSFVDADPVRSIGQVAQLLREHRVERVKIDSNGVGWGVYGALRSSSSKHNPTPSAPSDITHDAEVIPVNFGEGPTLGREHLFLNKRAEAYWYAREQVRLERIDMSAVDDAAKQELSLPVYEVLDAKGKIKIQSKADIIKQLGRSPDEADAIVYALWDVQSEAVISPQAQSLGDVNLLRDVEPNDWTRSQPIGYEAYEPLNPVSVLR